MPPHKYLPACSSFGLRRLDPPPPGGREGAWLRKAPPHTAMRFFSRSLRNPPLPLEPSVSKHGDFFASPTGQGVAFWLTKIKDQNQGPPPRSLPPPPSQWPPHAAPESAFSLPLTPVLRK